MNRIDMVFNPDIRSAHHGDFDDDKATVPATFALIVGKTASKAKVDFQRSTSSRVRLRQNIEAE